MRRLYIVEHWIPFPMSEYGGVWILIADSDEQAVDMLCDFHPSLNYRNEWQPTIEKQVKEAKKIVVADDEPIGLRHEFIT